jgi:hypothetical protein
MSKKTEQNFGTKIMTANMLVGGNVVYLATGNRWDRKLANARVVENDDALTTLSKAAQEAVTNGVVVGPYAMAVEISSAGPQLQLLSKREQIRATGPTIKADYSEQAISNV